MLDIVLDTKFWIELKQPKVLKRLRKLRESREFRLNFTRENFIDLAKANDQDQLSGILSEIVDRYVVIEDFNSNAYYCSESPLLLGQPDDREFIAKQTQDFEEEKTLKYMFRIHDQDQDQRYLTNCEALRDIYREYGEDYLDMTAFWKYVETTDTGSNRLDYTESTALSYIHRKLRTEHAKQLQPNENIPFQDRMDIRLCTYGTVVGDIFVVEEKWVNQDIISSALEGVDDINPPVLATSLDEFSKALFEFSTG